MAKSIFISYSHKQGDWVWNGLKPVLAAGGAEVLIDRESIQSHRQIIWAFCGSHHITEL